MRQYESCIQIIIIKKKYKNKKTEEKSKASGEREREEREGNFIFFLTSLLSTIYGNRTIGFCRRRRQSWSTRRELRVGTKILEFRQTLQARKFSYLCYF